MVNDMIHLCFQWVRWALNDDSRAEMPLSDDNDETFPCGMAINRNSTLNIREGNLVSMLRFLLCRRFTKLTYIAAGQSPL